MPSKSLRTTDKQSRFLWPSLRAVAKQSRLKANQSLNYLDRHVRFTHSRWPTVIANRVKQSRFLWPSLRAVAKQSRLKANLSVKYLDRHGFASRWQRIPHHNREIKIYSTKIKADAYFRSATSNYPVMEFTIPWVDPGFSSSFAERRTFFALVDFDHYLWLSEVQIWEKSAF